jgi:hypothetical protein
MPEPQMCRRAQLPNWDVSGRAKGLARRYDRGDGARLRQTCTSLMQSGSVDHDGRTGLPRSLEGEPHKILWRRDHMITIRLAES